MNDYEFHALCSTVDTINPYAYDLLCQRDDLSKSEFMDKLLQLL